MTTPNNLYGIAKSTYNGVPNTVFQLSGNTWVPIAANIAAMDYNSKSSFFNYRGFLTGESIRPWCTINSGDMVFLSKSYVPGVGEVQKLSKMTPAGVITNLITTLPSGGSLETKFIVDSYLNDIYIYRREYNQSLDKFYKLVESEPGVLSWSQVTVHPDTIAKISNSNFDINNQKLYVPFNDVNGYGIAEYNQNVWPHDFSVMTNYIQMSSDYATLRILATTKNGILVEKQHFTEAGIFHLDLNLTSAYRIPNTWYEDWGQTRPCTVWSVNDNYALTNIYTNSSSNSISKISLIDRSSTTLETNILTSNLITGDISLDGNSWIVEQNDGIKYIGGTGIPAAQPPVAPTFENMGMPQTIDLIGFSIMLPVISNSAPTNITISNNTVAENADINAVVGTLSTVDPDVGDTFTYTLVFGEGDTDNSSFNISGNNLRANSSFDYETKNSYSVRIRSTDSGSEYFEKQFNISVTNINEAPTDISLSSSSMIEGNLIGDLVAVISHTGGSSNITYSLPTYGDNASFSIVDSNLNAAEIFDYETKSSYNIKIRASDIGGDYFEKIFTINIVFSVALTPESSGIQIVGNKIIANISCDPTIGNVTYNGLPLPIGSIVRNTIDTQKFIKISGGVNAFLPIEITTKSSWNWDSSSIAAWSILQDK